MARSPTLSATLIARDETRCIARCLNSVAPFVDHILVLDTGSADATADIARRCGAEVHHLIWPEDFSAARNHALDLADADWNLVIDADEWIESGGESLRDWCAHGLRVGAARIDSGFDLEAAPDASNRVWIPRLLPRGVRYAGRVHEQPLSDLPTMRTALHLGHDGYREAQAAHKRSRNAPLLLLDLADDPGDPYILYQLGKDAEANREHDRAADYYGRSFAATGAAANWRHALTVRYLHCLGQSGGRAEALALAERHMAEWQDSPDFFFVLGNLLLDSAMADPAGALDRWLPMAVTAWERCLAIGERPDLEGSVHGRGSHLARHNLDVVRGQLALNGV